MDGGLGDITGIPLADDIRVDRYTGTRKDSKDVRLSTFLVFIIYSRTRRPFPSCLSWNIMMK